MSKSPFFSATEQIYGDDNPQNGQEPDKMDEKGIEAAFSENKDTSGAAQNLSSETIINNKINSQGNDEFTQTQVSRLSDIEVFEWGQSRANTPSIYALDLQNNQQSSFRSRSTPIKFSPKTQRILATFATEQGHEASSLTKSTFGLNDSFDGESKASNFNENSLPTASSLTRSPLIRSKPDHFQSQQRGSRDQTEVPVENENKLESLDTNSVIPSENPTSNGFSQSNILNNADKVNSAFEELEKRLFENLQGNEDLEESQKQRIREIIRETAQKLT